MNNEKIKDILNQCKIKYEEFFNDIKKIIFQSNNIKEFYEKLNNYHQQKNIKKEIRELLQKIINEYANQYKLKHIPIYISDKYKISKRGKFLFSSQPKAIIMFYLGAYHYNEINSLFVINFSSFIQSFFHEVAHYIDFKTRRFYIKHDEIFYKILDKIIIKI